MSFHPGHHIRGIVGVAFVKTNGDEGFSGQSLQFVDFPEHNANLRFIPLQEPDVVRRIGLVKARNCTLAPAAQIMETFLLESLQGKAT